MDTMFQLASRLKLRFVSPRGALSVEDLWDLPLTSDRGPSLDDIAKGLHKSLREADGEVSFVKPAMKKADTLQLQFDIVKHIIDIRVAERDAAQLANQKAATKQKLLSLIARKQDADLEGKSVEDLQAMLASL